jgi:hypothetical protein
MIFSGRVFSIISFLLFASIFLLLLSQPEALSKLAISIAAGASEITLEIMDDFDGFDDFYDDGDDDFYEDEGPVRDGFEFLDCIYGEYGECDEYDSYDGLVEATNYMAWKAEECPRLYQPVSSPEYMNDLRIANYFHQAFFAKISHSMKNREECSRKKQNKKVLKIK